MPNTIQGDKGKQFVNQKFKSFLKDQKVYFFSMENDDKSAKSLVDAVAYIFTTSNIRPNTLQGDTDKEFVNRKFKSFLKYQKVHFFSTDNDDIKASVVQRFN